MQEVSGSVGRGCANFEPDVLIVQQLINGGNASVESWTPLRLDGRCGSLTMDAITEFQRRVVRMTSPDGRVDPGGKTLEALVAHGSGEADSPKVLVTARPGRGNDTRTMPTRCRRKQPSRPPGRWLQHCGGSGRSLPNTGHARWRRSLCTRLEEESTASTGIWAT